MGSGLSLCYWGEVMTTSPICMPARFGWCVPVSPWVCLLRIHLGPGLSPSQFIMVTTDGYRLSWVTCARVFYFVGECLSLMTSLPVAKCLCLRRKNEGGGKNTHKSFRVSITEECSYSYQPMFPYEKCLLKDLWAILCIYDQVELG